MALEMSRRQMTELLFEEAIEIRSETDWQQVEDLVLTWFIDLKAAESNEEFYPAFTQSRMTVRCILEERHTGYYEPEKVMHLTKGIQENSFDLKTKQGIEGTKDRMKYENFFGDGKRQRKKYTDGLFDVSAVLLDGTRSLKIGEPPNQMYRTSGNTTYIFMPVPTEDDMFIYFMLLHLAKSSHNTSMGLRVFASYMKSRLTRIKLAFDGDAGAIFVNVATEGELLPKIRYGYGNKMKRSSTPEQVFQRKLDALTYKSVLNGGNRNEIILAYRQHGLLACQPSAFPLYAKGAFVKTNNPNSPDHCGFVVVDDNYIPTGKVIELNGILRDGTADSLSPGASINHHSPKKK